MLSAIDKQKVLGTPTKSGNGQQNVSSPSNLKKNRLFSSLSSPMKSHSFSSLQHQSSPSQISAKKLLRKYNSNVCRLSGQRREISSLRKSLPHMTPASSDLDLVLEAITYIQQLQKKLVSMTDVTNHDDNDNKHDLKNSNDKVYEERLV